MSVIFADAQEWQSLIQSQDDFVLRLLKEKEELHARASARSTPTPAAATPRTPTGTPTPAPLDEESSDALRGYAEHLEHALKENREVAESKISALVSSIAEKDAQLAYLTAQLESRPLPHQSSLAQSPAAATAAQKPALPSKGAGPPYILVLIDGSSAPFADGLISQASSGQTGGFQAATQVRWEVEKDIRAFDVAIETDDESNQPAEVIAIVYHNKAALVDSLIKARVISSPATWDEFTLAFNSGPLNHMVDIGKAKVQSKLAPLLSILAPTTTLKRIYLVGVEPKTLFTALPDIDPSKQEKLLSKRTAFKIVSVNHRETESDRQELSKTAWRVTTFARFFSPNGGLGGDWGIGEHLNKDSYTPGRDYASVDASEKMTGKGNWTSGAGGGNGGGGAGPDKWTMSGVKSGPAKKGSKPRKLELDSGKSYQFQNPALYVLSPAQLEGLRKEVATIPCKELVKKGLCSCQKKRGVPCMFSHDFRRRMMA